MAKKRSEVNLSSLAARVESTLESGDKDGFLNLFSYSQFAIILDGFIEYSPQISVFERSEISKKVALNYKNLPRPVTEKVLLRACSDLESLYLARPWKGYRVLTEISLGWTLSVPNARIGSISLTFRPKQDRAYSLRARLAHDSRILMDYALPSNYTRVMAYVKARSPAEAAERGLDAIDLLRASWNLSLNRGSPWRKTLSGQVRPINGIVLSPFHTVHNEDGDLATENFWYEPNYLRPVKVFNEKSHFSNCLKFSKNLRECLSVLPYREEIEGALLRYVRALDSADMGDVFLRLWSLLEYLTASVKDPYTVTIRRAAFLFDDKEIASLVLSNLMNYRNRFVHAGSEGDDVESLVFQLKRYVDELFVFHLSGEFGFNSRGDAAKFMDLPQDIALLKQKKKQIQQAINFVSAR